MNLVKVVMAVNKFPSVARLDAFHAIFCKLQRWLRYPFLQPHEVIFMQAFGMGGRDSSRGANWPSRCIHPISVTGGRSGYGKCA